MDVLRRRRSRRTAATVVAAAAATACVMMLDRPASYIAATTAPNLRLSMSTG